MRTRSQPKIRTREILAVAIQEAEKDGFQNITILSIADRVGCSRALVHTYFNTIVQLKRAVMRSAIKDENLLVVAQGLVAKDPTARKAPDILKDAALASVR